MKLYESERKAMEVLWAHGEATAGERTDRQLIAAEQDSLLQSRIRCCSSFPWERRLFIRKAGGFTGGMLMENWWWQKKVLKKSG